MTMTDTILRALTLTGTTGETTLLPHLQILALLRCRGFSGPALIKCLNSRKGDVPSGFPGLEQVRIVHCAGLGPGEKAELEACAARSFHLHVELRTRLDD